ncbi:unnamed protein product, partial [Haemonchus placei]|uniref:Neur_chan_memb domain-containing protein n=1 Tax=Haemonchus placei TaxID=6290 RepID=A0A0N4X7N6_HAEPC
QVNVTWFDSNPIRSNPEIGLPEFVITAVAKGYCNGTYRYALMPNSYKLDNFSCLEGNLYLSRSIGYNLVQSYIPTGLIVMISWVSFWIDRRAVPARVTLSFTTLVSLTTLGNGLRFGLPQVSYVKAIDLWYGACMLFVFSALLEFAIINSYMRKSEKFDSMGKRIYSSVHSGRSECHLLKLVIIEPPKNPWENLDQCKIFVFLLLKSFQMSQDYSRQALRIDKQCRYGFPLTFLAWNLWYWWYYLVFQKVDYFSLIE